MSEWAISVRGLVKDFGTSRHVVRALAGLSFNVAPGETYGLIGPDGAGKTTTTRVILGLLSRTGGESSVLGFDSMRDSYEIHRRVGYIAQQFALPPQLTVRENMAFFAGLQALSPEEYEPRIPRLLSFAGLTDAAGQLASRLSGGMKKKLALACSLIHEPSVVILDEPTLGVDPVSRREFWNLLGNLQVERGLTIFVCTPYMDEAERCTQIGLISQGSLIASGTPESIRRTVPGELVELTPSQMGTAKTLIGDIEGVLEVQSFGERLRVFVDHASLRTSQIKAALEGAGIQYEGCRETEASMEEAFISLISRHGAVRHGVGPGG